MVKKLIDKMNSIKFIVVTSIILLCVLMLGVFHVLNMLLVMLIVIVLICVFSYILTIKDNLMSKKREKKEDEAYLALKNKPLQELAELSNLSAKDAEHYSKLQDVTLFDLFRIAKRAEEGSTHE